jgi:4-diphosphocytidyl-2-C-methyl-D-erythritol kinase
MLTLKAPAKINLTLEVLGKRQDGYHEIRSVIQTISLYDSLRFQLSRSIEFKSNQSDWVAGESLVSKAASLLQGITGSEKGAMVEIDKHIPLLSGLAGDSSDAATVLRGLNKLWGLGLSRDRLAEVASLLGSDVAFFLYGGTALVKGRGEIVTPLPPPSPVCVVLLIPEVPRASGKTKRLYAKMETGHHTSGQITDRFVDQLTKGGEVIPSMLFNAFDAVARDSYAGIADYWEQFLRAGAEAVHLAGSGPTLFTITKNRAEAEKIYLCLQEEKLTCCLVQTTSAID